MNRHEVLEPCGQFPLSDKQRDLVERTLGKITDVRPALGGLVHQVYKVRAENGQAVLKIRENHFSRLPSISIDPDVIKHEYNALLLLSSLEPDVFPQVLGYDSEAHAILMSDVIPNGKTLEEELNRGTVGYLDVRSLGQVVARVHKKLKSFEGDWREEGDVETYRSDIQYSLGYHEIKALDEVMWQLGDRPKQLILGDLSPKNIAKSNDGKIKICDLDSFYKGNLEYTLGFLIGHLIVHNLTDQSKAVELVTGLMEGYRKELPELNLEDTLLQKIALGIILYRLKNSVIPYAVFYNNETRAARIKTANALLSEGNLTWDYLIEKMTNSDEN